MQEILWESEVNPKTKMVDLDDEDYMQVYSAIKKVVPAVIESGGKDTEKDLYGNFGGYRHMLVKMRLERLVNAVMVRLRKNLILVE